MAMYSVPYEIKSMVYEYTDLPTLKILRQVSKSWATAGLDLLLLPTFTINSSRDIDRLVSISTSSTVAQHAARTVRCLSFQSHGWDPEYFRNIVCNRHELLEGYEAMDFVPTQAEGAALDELDAVIEQKNIDSRYEKDLDLVTSALRTVPGVDAIRFCCHNPFTHPILRKTWEEYDLVALRLDIRQSTQLVNILQISERVGLTIQHLTHERLLSGVFALPTSLNKHIDALKHLRSLHLVITDLPEFFTSDPDVAPQQLRRLIHTSPYLKSLSIAFDVLGTVPVAFLEPPQPAIPVPHAPSPSLSAPPFAPSTRTLHTLHTLSLSSISFSPTPFLAFLATHARSLKRLRLRMADFLFLPPTSTYISTSTLISTWRGFLEELRDRLGGSLEKFQLSGMVRGLGSSDDQNWILFPLYDDDWVMIDNSKNGRTRELEDFVLRGGRWPMVASDNFPLS